MANRVVIGDLGSGQYGARTSVPGANALNMSLPPKQVTFDSRRDTSSKIIVSGTAAAGATVSFGETLPYIPTVLSDPYNPSEYIEIYYGTPWRGINMELPEYPPLLRVYNNRITTPYGALYIALRD